jgi:hypothetical protein
MAAFANSFRVAGEKGATSITLPALGAQLFKNPIDIVVDAYWAAVDTYVKAAGPSAPVKLIRLTDLDAGVVAKFREQFDKKYGTVPGVRKWKVGNTEAPLVAYPEYQWFYMDGGWKPYDEDSNWQIDAAYKNDKNSEITLLIAVSDSAKGKDYKINLGQMRQVNIASNFQRGVKHEKYVPKADAPPPDDEEEFEPEDASSSQLVYQIRVAALRNKLAQAVALVLASINKLVQTVTCQRKVLVPPAMVDELTSLCRHAFVGLTIDTSPDGHGAILTFQGAEELITKARTLVDDKLQELAPVSVKVYPDTWVPQPGDVAMVPVPTGGHEWLEAERRLKETLANATLLKVERVQNKPFWDLYTFRKKRLEGEGATAKPANEALLWHGTQNPKAIYDSSDGFQTNFANTGMWGMLLTTLLAFSVTSCVHFSSRTWNLFRCQRIILQRWLRSLARWKPKTNVPLPSCPGRSCTACT